MEMMTKKKNVEYFTRRQVLFKFYFETNRS